MKLGNDDFSTDKHGWAEFLPKRVAAQPLNATHRVPWVVIGAGVTGLAAARRLAQLHPDQQIILLDARLVGQGSSGRNYGFAVSVSHFPGRFDTSQLALYRRINRINQAGLGLLRGQVDEHAIDCDWYEGEHEGGFHHTAADKPSLRACEQFLHYLEALEIAHTPLDGEALRARLGTGLYRAGVHVHEGVLLHPAALVRGLADTLPANVSVHEQSPVLAIDRGSPIRLQLAESEIIADKLIMATSYEAVKLGILRRYLVGSTLSGSFTRVLTDAELASLGALDQWGVLSLHPGGATVRLTFDRRLCLRNTAEYHGSNLLSEKQLTARQAIHRAGFENRFAQLAHVPFEYAWSGVEGASGNKTSFFGEQDKNIYFAGGYNGSGVSRGTAFGWALAEYASGSQSALVEDCLAFGPGTWMPPRPLLDVGAFMVVRSRFRGVGLDR
jgi:glycine/D-amino acid oxidase-like deaminating enzyme